MTDEDSPSRAGGTTTSLRVGDLMFDCGERGRSGYGEVQDLARDILNRMQVRCALQFEVTVRACMSGRTRWQKCLQTSEVHPVGGFQNPQPVRDLQSTSLEPLYLLPFGAYV